MINTKGYQTSEIFNHPQSGYILPNKDFAYNILSDQICDDCKMSRLAMSCYAATKHQYPEKDQKVARLQPKEKKFSNGQNKYGEMETSVSLDKYNGKMMNSIWGLYNRNSPHNFKSLQNAEKTAMMNQEQGMKTEKFGSSFVQFTIPQFNGIVGVLETKFEVNKPKTSLEKMETLFSSPIF